MAQQHDMINHPPHYTQHPAGVECIDIIEWLPYNIGAAIKYLWRHGLKNDAVEDLSKAKWHIDREIERLKRCGNEQNYANSDNL
jgi:hypothetical protein